MWGVQTQHDTPLFLVPFCKDLARMIECCATTKLETTGGTGPETKSLNHESHYQTPTYHTCLFNPHKHDLMVI